MVEKHLFRGLGTWGGRYTASQCFLCSERARQPPASGTRSSSGWVHLGLDFFLQLLISFLSRLLLLVSAVSLPLTLGAAFPQSALYKQDRKAEASSGKRQGALLLPGRVTGFSPIVAVS